jgi:C1A family cysteine protease
MTGNDLVTSMKNLLLSKQPIMIAIAVYDSFMTDAVAITGMVPMPDLTIENCQGGHELCVVGYDDGKQAFLVLNSWGSGWGLKGNCYIPYAYIANGDLCFEVTYFTI